MLIRLIGIPIFAYHGVYDEEKENGNRFEIDVELEVPETSGTSDDLKATIDYSQVYKVVLSTSESERYNLLETFAEAISRSILHSFPSVLSALIKVRKLNPPIGGDIQYVEIESRRKQTDA